MKFFKNVFPNLIILISPLFLLSIFLTPKQAEANAFTGNLTPYNCLNGSPCTLDGEVTSPTISVNKNDPTDSPYGSVSYTYVFRDDAGNQVAQANIAVRRATYGQKEPITLEYIVSNDLYSPSTPVTLTINTYITKSGSNLQNGSIYLPSSGGWQYIIETTANPYDTGFRTLNFNAPMLDGGNFDNGGDYDFVMIIHAQHANETTPYYSGIARVPFSIASLSSDRDYNYCEIPTGHSGCTFNLNWGIKKPIISFTSGSVDNYEPIAITTNSPADNTILKTYYLTSSNATGGSIPYTISGENTQDFYLYHNGQEFASTEVQTSCAPGVDWNATDKVCGEPLKTPKITFSMVNKKNNENINVSLGTLLGVPILMNTSSILANDPIDIEWKVENPEAFNLSNIQCTANGDPQPKGNTYGHFTVYPSTTTKYSVHCTDE